jgi:hypothetical protein
MGLGRRTTFALSLVVLGCMPLGAQTSAGTAFTYQGRLTDGGSPANATYDLQFTLYDAAGGGNAVGSAVTHTNVPVASGVFSVLLDFGASAFTGSARWLEVGVRPGGTGGGFTIVSPRHQLTPIPYALDVQRLGGLPASSYQVRVTGACSSGNFMRAVGADGSVTCAQVAGSDIAGSVPGHVTEAQLAITESRIDDVEARVTVLEGSAALRDADQIFSGANWFSGSSNTFTGQFKVVGNTGVCDASKAGSLRYDAGATTIQFCNGSAWLTLATTP